MRGPSTPAEAAGARWALACITSLSAEGRHASGGFPGTMREARALDGVRFGTSSAEIESAARAAYAAAKRTWRLNQVRESREPCSDE
jgi:hypothetical protein